MRLGDLKLQIANFEFQIARVWRRACLTICILQFAICNLQFSSAAEVDPAVLDAEAARVEVVAKASAATVAIFGKSGNDGGSGVVISPDGFALSNFHVTNGGGNWMHSVATSSNDRGHGRTTRQSHANGLQQ